MKMYNLKMIGMFICIKQFVHQKKIDISHKGFHKISLVIAICYRSYLPVGSNIA